MLCQGKWRKPVLNFSLNIEEMEKREGFLATN